MDVPFKYVVVSFGISLSFFSAFAQTGEMVKVLKDINKNEIDVFIGSKPFTSFLYPDTLEKPVLYPVFTGKGTDVTRGFPLHPKPGDPTDHPHHIGIWFNYENVNGLDFWNNSYAITKEKKNQYGRIKTDKILNIKSGTKGVLTYHANWVDQKNDVLLEENTKLEFSAVGNERLIDRTTVLKAKTEVAFKDAKDGLLGLRLAHELQMPTKEDQKFTDGKGNATVVKGETDNLVNGNYITSEGKTGNDAWGTRGNWCMVYGKMGNDSVSIVMIDHPQNLNYPTFWHARGYGLFAANPLGEKIFTNGKSAKNLQLKKGESVTFRYRIVVDEAENPISTAQIRKLATDFAHKKQG